MRVQVTRCVFHWRQRPTTSKTTRLVSLGSAAQSLATSGRHLRSLYDVLLHHLSVALGSSLLMLAVTHTHTHAHTHTVVSKDVFPVYQVRQGGTVVQRVERWTCDQ